MASDDIVQTQIGWQQSREAIVWLNLTPRVAAEALTNIYLERSEEEAILRAMLAVRDNKTNDAEFWLSVHTNLADHAQDSPNQSSSEDLDRSTNLLRDTHKARALEEALLRAYLATRAHDNDTTDLWISVFHKLQVVVEWKD